jgi:glutathione S-transferase
MNDELILVSHKLCPYVQRVAIVLAEKGIAYTRRDVDLSNPPRWFQAISPLGKTPVLSVGDTALFESAVICEYLEEAYPRPLHPAQPLERARHRSWMEFGSSILDNIAGFYSAPDSKRMAQKREALAQQFQRLESELTRPPYFSGTGFSMVDAFFGPVFRYFDVFEQIGDFGFFERCPRVLEWRGQLMARDSVRRAVAADYPRRLYDFLHNKNSALSRCMVG